MEIQIKNLTFSYPSTSTPVLSDLSVTFSRQAITVLTGCSGCGKSTLLYLAAGIYPHVCGVMQSGSVMIGDTSPENLSPPERCRRVGMMFQNPELQFCMDTPFHEIVFCLENIGAPEEEIAEKTSAALEFSGILPLKDRTLISLSGGEKQKVMLACLYALAPEWLLLDEPFANIDETAAGEIAEKLKQLHQERGTGILAVDHRLDHWLSVADEIRIFADGKIGAPVALHPLPRTLLRQSGILVPQEPYAAPRPARTAGKEALQLRHLSVRRGATQVLSDFSAVFCHGMSYAVLGESGCGKSTLFGALSGIYPYEGTVLLHGKKLGRRNAGKIGFVTQNPQDQLIAGSVFQEIRQSLRSENSAQADARTEEILRGIHLWRYRDVSAYTLSQGQQRRLGVAALLAYQCDVLVCDEPTYAQDRDNTIAIMNGLMQMVEEQNICLIFATHDWQLANDYADVIWKIEEGELREESKSGS